MSMRINVLTPKSRNSQIEGAFFLTIRVRLAVVLRGEDFFLLSAVLRAVRAKGASSSEVGDSKCRPSSSGRILSECTVDANHCQDPRLTRKSRQHRHLQLHYRFVAGPLSVARKQQALFFRIMTRGWKEPLRGTVANRNRVFQNRRR